MSDHEEMRKVTADGIAQMADAYRAHDGLGPAVFICAVQRLIAHLEALGAGIPDTEEDPDNIIHVPHRFISEARTDQ